MIVLLLVILFFATLLLTVWSVTSRTSGRGPATPRVSPALAWLHGRLTARRGVLIAVGLFALLLGAASLTVIPAGHRGVVFNVFEGVQSRVLEPGIHVVVPLVNAITTYDVRSQAYSMVGGSEDQDRRSQSDTLWAPTADGLRVGLDLTVRFRPDPQRLPELHSTIGPEYQERIVRPQIRNVARMVVAEYVVMDIYGRGRSGIQRQMFDRLKGMFAGDGIVLEDILLRNVAFSADFEKAIELKMTAAQKVQQMEFEVQQARMRAEARQQEAAGEAAALETVNRTLQRNPRLLEYVWINKLSDKVSVLVVPRDQSGLIVQTPSPAAQQGQAPQDGERTARALSTSNRGEGQ